MEFCVVEVFFDGRRGVSPFGGHVHAEYPGYGAPANIAGKHGLVFSCCVTVTGFEDFDQPDRSDIVARLFMQAALSDPVRACDPEIAGRSFLWFGVDYSRCGAGLPVALLSPLFSCCSKPAFLKAAATLVSIESSLDASLLAISTSHPPGGKIPKTENQTIFSRSLRDPLAMITIENIQQTLARGSPRWPSGGGQPIEQSV